ncbi:MAG TPA: HD domain-containing protein [Herpetosiphon sp.]|uniref:Metal dependent phosphohydrolase n=1 Tax=Herpetosiphon aurantiacus (strain ATCC 23779 / DSM 785 / 114-95) TaxID=316274 RepID=A9B569_HERA2|nr:HD domain-containing phosphohydrolase [Herpetosiphon sp.]ABX06206.1 metal dependent phosphohydrolase [Herpetosiphon aurantiacus DSM 785]HBW51854.1 HD domain-containing protein [Herpetosiphon sp.]
MTSQTVVQNSAFELEQVLVVIERADAIASSMTLDPLLDRMLALLIEIAGGEAGTLYLVDDDEIVFQVVHGDPASQHLVGMRLPINIGLVGATIRAAQPLWIEDINADPRWDRRLGEANSLQLRSLLSLPLLLEEQVVGVIQIFNPQRSEPRLLKLLGNRMAAEVEKARLLKKSQQRESRLSALVEIVGHIGSTLDRTTLLNLIIDYARILLDAEASSLFLTEPESGDLILQHSTGHLHERVQSVRLAKGRGIAGYVAETGETICVGDVKRDQRHDGSVDQMTGFETRSILAVPLRTRCITFGRERAQSEEHLIGCIEVLNKRDGRFDDDDKLLLQTLARQAATVLEIADLYADVNELFLDVIQALTAAIDAKDPYTEGHSKRVSEFAVAIAEELELEPSFIHHLRIGAILHDVGKIGISDGVLKKPGRLTDDEFGEMKSHPEIGERILGHIRMLQTELPVIIQHHERLDGSGYPYGLAKGQISLGGRIVAVADAFDAMTSDRPYRRGLPTEEAFRRLRAGADTEFDAVCVEALWQALNRGRVRPQRLRDDIGDHRIINDATPFRTPLTPSA